jgi:hypothetical protein
MLVRRAAYLALSAALVAAIPAVAGHSDAPKRPPPPRVVKISYAYPCSLSNVPTGGAGTINACPSDQQFKVLKGERFAEVFVADASGQGVSVAFKIAANGVRDQLPLTICRRAGRIAVSGGATYVVNPTFDANILHHWCFTPPTSGTITITLTRQ